MMPIYRSATARLSPARAPGRAPDGGYLNASGPAGISSRSSSAHIQDMNLALEGFGGKLPEDAGTICITMQTVEGLYS